MHVFVSHAALNIKCSILVQVRPVEPVLAIAQEAQRRGIPMAIASGGGREHVLGAIRANGLESMFQAFICAGVRTFAASES